jgi:hypothetical protein
VGGLSAHEMYSMTLLVFPRLASGSREYRWEY